MISANKHVLLVEPDYYTRYPPLGLLKLSTYHKTMGDTVELVRGCIRPSKKPDVIYVTSLFSWAWIPVHQAVSYFKRLYPDVLVTLGGIYASLLPEHAKTAGADYVQVGLHNEAEGLMPDYGLVPEWNGSIIFASRGCVRKCGFCSVPKLEGKPSAFRYSIKQMVYPKHNRIIFYDNNILGNPNWKPVFDEVIELGLKTDFNQGLDARLITDEAAQKLARMKIFPMIRLAYDFVGIGKYVEEAIHRLAAYGVSRRNIMVYVLFNYADSPEDFFTRVREVLTWGAVAYPMRYEPLCSLEKNRFVAPKWNPDSLTTIQRARRVLGYGGAFPPYEGLIIKLNKSSNFDEAFKLEPLKKITGEERQPMRGLTQVAAEHPDGKRYWTSLRKERNWRLVLQTK